MMALGDGMSQWPLLAGVALLTTLLLFRSLRRTAARRASAAGAGPAVRPGARPSTARRGVDPLPAEVAQWQVDMHELARELRGELDTKMRLLQLLIDQARAEAERLQALLAQVQAGRGARGRDEPGPPV